MALPSKKHTPGPPLPRKFASRHRPKRWKPCLGFPFMQSSAGDVPGSDEVHVPVRAERCPQTICLPLPRRSNDVPGPAALQSEEVAGFVVVNDFLTLCCVGPPTLHGQYGWGSWRFDPLRSVVKNRWTRTPFRPDGRHVIDLTLGVLLSQPRQSEILGYVALTRLFSGTRAFRLSPTGIAWGGAAGENHFVVADRACRV